MFGALLVCLAVYNWAARRPMAKPRVGVERQSSNPGQTTVAFALHGAMLASDFGVKV